MANVAGAIFSNCRKYRYVLWRVWDINKPMVMLIGLNPSKAGGLKNDNTIIKIAKVARHNGFGGFYMLNLFSIISTKPKILTSGVDTLKDNDRYLKEYAGKCDKIVFCWGDFKQSKERAEVVKKMFEGRALFCFDHNQSGSPKHPLYCLDETLFIPYNQTI